MWWAALLVDDCQPYCRDPYYTRRTRPLCIAVYLCGHSYAHTPILQLLYAWFWDISRRASNHKRAVVYTTRMGYYNLKMCPHNLNPLLMSSANTLSHHLNTKKNRIETNVYLHNWIITFVEIIEKLKFSHSTHCALSTDRTFYEGKRSISPIVLQKKRKTYLAAASREHSAKLSSRET